MNTLVNELRPLGLGDVIHLRRLLALALEASDRSTLTSFVAEGWLAVQQPLTRWLLTLTQLKQPWTLSDLSEVLETLSEHEDMVRFLSNLIPAEEPSKAGAGKKLELRHLLDLVQARYGWADSYLVNKPGQAGEYLSYTRWLEVVETVLETRAVESRDAWRRAAFTNWAFYYFQPRTERHGVMGLGEWFSLFGLEGDDEYSGQTDEETIAAAHEMMTMLGFELEEGTLTIRQPEEETR